MKDPITEAADLPSIPVEPPQPATTKWNAETEPFLKNVVTLGKIHDWVRVASLMRTQFPTQDWTDADCKGHWEEIINGPNSKKPWTEQEELEMIVAHKLCNNKWSSVAGLINGRNNNSIKNRFYSIFRKVKNKVKRVETGFNSRIELLEILYMLSLMEVHLVQPFPPVIQKGKRGKDYVYSLLQNLRMEELETFKIELSKKAGKEVCLSDVWEELGIPLENSKFHLPENIRRIIAQDNSIPHNFGEALPQLPHIEPVDLSLPKCGITLPKWDPIAKPTGLTEEEKTFIHTQAFLSKAPQLNPYYYKDPISTGTYLNNPSLLTPGTVGMQACLQSKCNVEGFASPKFSHNGYGNLPHLASPGSPIPPLFPIQPSPSSIGSPVIQQQIMVPSSVVQQPQIVHYTSPGYIVQPMYQQPSTVMMVPMVRPGSPFPPTASNIQPY